MMSVNEQIPDYDLEQMVVVTAPEQLRALADPLRAMLLELLLERAATVTEMAQAVDRPKSTVAYHVNLLVDAGLLKVVRTRRVRAIEERYYGRVARTLYVGALTRAEDMELARRFAQIPRSGDQVYGFVAGLYPTDAPTLPDPEPDPEPGAVSA